MTPPKGTTKRRKKAAAGKIAGTYVSAMSVVGLVIVTIADLFSTNSIPTVVYFGLIGASLGAKFDDVASWIGGGRR